ncbi:MAG: aspartate ammonia-lyase [Rhodospirillales bacterium]|nr:aspartate ammonia-lyase [Rhodospirillales bacterium]
MIELSNPKSAARVDSDMLGECVIDNASLYGIHTWRALGNFPISGVQLGTEVEYVAALATTKLAAAQANHALGLLSDHQFHALSAACREVMEGRHLDHFQVDVMEGSGGTSTNMNVNEVLANRALDLLGVARGDYTALHPNDHVNRSQSTSDVVPTAMKLATFRKLTGLERQLEELGEAFKAKGREFANVLRLGRTCLQDALPMTLGQAFGAYGELVRRQADMVGRTKTALLAVPLGGTGIGSGLGTLPGYREKAVAALREATGIPFHSADDLFDATQNMDVFARVSAELRTTALSIAKIATDLMILSSGPVGGMAEISLPEKQAGSSMMPGKVNPVVPIAFCQVAFAVAGNDACIAIAANQGHLEINNYEPLIAARLFESLRLLTNGVGTFTSACVRGIAANEETCAAHLLGSTAIASALSPSLGYKRVSELVRTSRREGITFLDLLERENVMPRAKAMALIQEATGQVPGGLDGAGTAGPALPV